MLRGRKTRKLFFSVLIGAAVVCAGLYFVWTCTLTDSRLLQDNWSLNLPDNMQEVYRTESERGFQGDGVIYTVFAWKDGNSAVLNGASGEKNSDMENEVRQHLGELKAEKQWYPDFSHSYKWKRIFKDGSFRKLYILYFPEKSLIYFLQIII